MTTITVGSALESGTYRVLINIPKLKGVSGALYSDDQPIILTNTSLPIKPSAAPMSISYSNVSIDRTSVSSGQSIKVTFDMRSSGIPAGQQPIALLEIADQSSECEEECGDSVTKLVSGTISQGKWMTTITVGSALESGTYRVLINIPKLKGVSGALYYDNQPITLTNTSLPIKPSTGSIDQKPKNLPTIKSEPTKSPVLKNKKVTITCVKGKISKKVTNIKPKCPTGYSVKK
jgi:hypothetical protein